ncbi:MAG TPA: hypothetical protein VFE51_29835 [Verrucomicrobiae bacterium]|nr:hypothetical protein [Verrucomicrobiae bacterium]
MTFVECFPGEMDAILLQAVKETYLSTFRGACPIINFGRLIEWKERMFREVLVAAEGHQRLLQEDYIFHSFVKDGKRAAVQLGSLNGAAFQTPPLPGAENIALLIEGGRQSRISPFIYVEKA